MHEHSVEVAARRGARCLCRGGIDAAISSGYTRRERSDARTVRCWRHLTGRGASSAEGCIPCSAFTVRLQSVHVMRNAIDGCGHLLRQPSQVPGSAQARGADRTSHCASTAAASEASLSADMRLLGFMGRCVRRSVHVLVYCVLTTDVAVNVVAQCMSSASAIFSSRRRLARTVAAVRLWRCWNETPNTCGVDTKPRVVWGVRAQ